MAELSVAHLPVHDDDAPPAPGGSAREELSSSAVASDDVLGVIANAPASMNSLAAGSRTFLAQTRLSPQMRAEIALAVAELVEAHHLAAFYRQRLSAIRSDTVTGGAVDVDLDPLLALVRQTVGDVTDGQDQLAAALASGWRPSDIVDALRVAADALWMTWLSQASGLEAGEHGN